MENQKQSAQVEAQPQAGQEVVGAAQATSVAPSAPTPSEAPQKTPRASSQPTTGITRVTDKTADAEEIRAMSRISQTLARLTPAAQYRVVEWARNLACERRDEELRASVNKTHMSHY